MVIHGLQDVRKRLCWSGEDHSSCGILLWTSNVAVDIASDQTKMCYEDIDPCILGAEQAW